VHEYMSARSMILDEPQEQGLTAAQKTYQTMMGLLVKGLERQVRFVELKLSAKEMFLVQRELESNNLKLYRNTTMVNDCSTMIFRVLSKHTSLSINPFVDAYPTTAGQYLGLLKKLGNTQVGTAGLVVEKESNKPYSFVRNTYVAFLEGNIMISSLLLNAPKRAYVSLWIGEDGLQWWSDENKDSIQAWKASALKDLKEIINSDEYLKTEIDKINLSAAHLRTEQRKKLKEHLHQQLIPLESELLESMNARDLSIESIVSIQAKLAGLVQIEQEWFALIDGK
jgi:hypothetical protein